MCKNLEEIRGPHPGDPKAWTRCGYQDEELGNLENILPASKAIGTNIEQYSSSSQEYIGQPRNWATLRTLFFFLSFF